MIELPEAVTLARQMDAELRGKRTAAASTGTSPHKWVFYRPSRQQLEKKLVGRTVGQAIALGRGIRVSLGRGLSLLVDDFGGRVTYHAAASEPPKKYHLLIRLRDDSCVTIAIQGWGFVALLGERELREHASKRAAGLDPADRGFTLTRFKALFDAYENPDKDSIKTFFTNSQNVAGIGNGYLQDILFQAGIDPRRKVGQITAQESKALHEAVRDVVKRAVSLNGRTCERDLHGQPGRYEPLMDRHAAGKKCPRCGQTIAKIAYLGGSCYVCPGCQA